MMARRQSITLQEGLFRTALVALMDPQTPFLRHRHLESDKTLPIENMFIAIGAVCLVLIALIYLLDPIRRWMDRTFGCGGCGIARADAERERLRQLTESDVGQHVSEEDKGKTTDELRAERRAWYAEFLKPHSHVRCGSLDC